MAQALPMCEFRRTAVTRVARRREEAQYFLDIPTGVPVATRQKLDVPAPSDTTGPGIKIVWILIRWKGSSTAAAWPEPRDTEGNFWHSMARKGPETMFGKLLAKLSGSPDLQGTAEIVAVQAAESVWHRVRSRLPTLGMNEARGYIRTRAVPVLNEQIAAMISQGSLPGSRHAKVLDLAGEIVIRTMLQRAATVPARTHVLRRAA
ncbi:MAG: hypothetical protein FJ295_11920 [Planctomycetes bacterium]|nr:hypothetical protein [Planctomycetota bacterium]